MHSTLILRFIPVCFLMLSGFTIIQAQKWTDIFLNPFENVLQWFSKIAAIPLSALALSADNLNKFKMLTKKSDFSFFDFAVVFPILKSFPFFSELSELYKKYNLILKNNLPVTKSLPPEAYLDTPNLISSRGFVCETHYIKTVDGYILQVHRIPHGRTNADAKPREPVLLMHGIFSSSADWCLNNANESIAYILADSGYDVWIGNVRGNKYGRNHTTRDPKNKEFWQFSVSEFAKYDLPSTIDYILETTKFKQVYYIGFSMGAQMAYAMLSSKTEYNDKIKIYFSLAAVTDLEHMKSQLVRTFLSIGPILYQLLEIAQMYELFTHSAFQQFVVESACTTLISNVCKELIGLVQGPVSPTLDLSRLHLYLSHAPAGSSLNVGNHFIQLFNSKRFQYYDYGNSKKNKEEYGTERSPLYNITLVTVKVVLFTGSNDYLASLEDAKKLAEKLPNVMENFKVEGHSHIDVIIALNAREKIYDKIVDKMKKNPIGEN